MSSAVRLAAMMPASRAASRGLPFFTAPWRIAVRAAADIVTRPDAVASRSVAVLAATSTIRMRPCGSTCVSFGRAMRLILRRGGAALRVAVAVGQEERQALQRHRQVDALELDARRHPERAGREVEHRLDPAARHLVEHVLGGL